MTTHDVWPKILAFVLVREGGYTNNPADSGGATNHGITQRVYDDYRHRKGQALQSVVKIADTEVSDIYLTQYWLPSGCPLLPPALAAAVMDFAVNAGVGRARATLKKVSQQDPQAAFKYTDLRDAFYRGLAEAEPKDAVFLKGWLARDTALRMLLNTL